MIKETALTLAMQRYAEVVAKAIDRYRERYIEPLLDVGTPERVLGKPYQEWTEQDMQLLAQVFGFDLDRYMARREVRLASKGVTNG